MIVSILQNVRVRDQVNDQSKVRVKDISARRNATASTPSHDRCQVIEMIDSTLQNVHVRGQVSDHALAPQSDRLKMMVRVISAQRNASAFAPRHDRCQVIEMIVSALKNVHVRGQVSDHALAPLNDQSKVMVKDISARQNATASTPHHDRCQVIKVIVTALKNVHVRGQVSGHALVPLNDQSKVMVKDISVQRKANASIPHHDRCQMIEMIDSAPQNVHVSAL
jgi:hypothetical protein